MYPKKENYKFVIDSLYNVFFSLNIMGFLMYISVFSYNLYFWKIFNDETIQKKIDVYMCIILDL